MKVESFCAEKMEHMSVRNLYVMSEQMDVCMQENLALKF